MISNSLTGRRIAITGAGRGLGRALAITAADDGADLVLLGRDVAALREVASIIASRSGRAAHCIGCDLAQPDSIRIACDALLKLNPVVDVLINNAAPWLSGPLAEASTEDVLATVTGGVAGTILVTKGLLPGLRRSRAADIVTIVSTAGWPGWDLGGAPAAAFHAMKHAQSGFSDRLRQELKAEGIRVMALYPPDFDDVDPLGPDWADEKKAAARGHLTSRDVTATVLFALSAPRACTYPVIMLDNMPAR
jgi:NAD(P)-dependent dehydrogenase (short-subunit alcohol dehydrogenase family)